MVGILNNLTGTFLPMLDLKTLVESGITDFNVTIKYQDLLSLTDSIVERILDEIVPAAGENAVERLMTKQEVMEKFGVCHTTLHNWNKSGVLVPVKVGRKIHYRQGDVQELLARKGR